MSLPKILPGAVLLLSLAVHAAAQRTTPLPVNNAPADRQRYRTEAMNEAMFLLGNWQSDWTQDNARAVAGHYAPEALLVLPGRSDPVRGSAAIAQRLAETLPAMGRIELQLVDAQVGDDMLWLVHRYAVAAPAEAADLSTPPVYAGHVSTLLQRDPGGRWRIRAHVFAPGPVAAGAALLRGTGPAAAPQRPADAVLANLSCSSFEWLPQEGVGEQGAIRIPVELNGQLYQFRLDTGSDATVIYGDEAVKRAWPQQGPSAVMVQRVHLGGTDLGPARITTNPLARPGATAGTVGLDLLMNHLVVIDYRAQHFCLVPRVAVPPELDGRVEWVAGEIRNGRLFVPLKVAGKPLDGLYFDTGASGLPLSVDQETWQALTGRAGEREATSRITAAVGAGEAARFVGAPATGPMELAGKRVEAPLVYYHAAEPRHFHGWSFPATGAFGNANFRDSIVLLSLGAWPAFGILR